MFSISQASTEATVDGAERVSKGKAVSGTPGPEGSRRPFMDTLTLYLGYLLFCFLSLHCRAVGLSGGLLTWMLKGHTGWSVENRCRGQGRGSPGTGQETGTMMGQNQGDGSAVL